MLRMSGYFFPAVKPGGFITQVSTLVPSKLVYQKSSGVTSWSLENSESLTCVSWVRRRVCASSAYTSGRCVGSPMVSASVRASGVAL